MPRIGNLIIQLHGVAMSVLLSNHGKTVVKGHARLSPQGHAASNLYREQTNLPDQQSGNLWKTCKHETSNCSEIPVCARLLGFAPVWREFAPVLRVKSLAFFAIVESAENRLNQLISSSCQEEVMPQRIIRQHLDRLGSQTNPENSSALALHYEETLTTLFPLVLL